LTGYELDVYVKKAILLATADEDDVEIFQMKSRLVMENFAKIGWIQQSILKQECRGFSKKNRPRNDSRCNENIEKKV
jgi:hypothetical protein